MGFSLGDDGTLDTVIVCDDCSQEFRYNAQSMPEHYTSCKAGVNDDAPCTCYETFVAWAKEDASESHDCSQ